MQSPSEPPPLATEAIGESVFSDLVVDLLDIDVVVLELEDGKLLLEVLDVVTFAPEESGVVLAPI